MKKEVIHISADNLELLVTRIVDVIREKYGTTLEDWITEGEAMRILNIKSKSTMLALRAEGVILYSQPKHKIILYSRTSLSEYLAKHIRKTF